MFQGKYMTLKGASPNPSFKSFLSLVFLISWLRLHQFLGIKTTEMNKSLKTEANGAN